MSYLGARPVFADVDADTWCLTPASFEACLTDRTKAVIPVDGVRQHAGHGADSSRSPNVVAFAFSKTPQKPSARCTRANRPACSATWARVQLSRKVEDDLATGEGGMLVTDDSVLYERMLEHCATTAAARVTRRSTTARSRSSTR